jgi:hypothetical protein
MLKKKVATSRRLSELKTDQARLLWTWLLPFLDVEGRYHANENIIKGTIFPRLAHFTPRKIKAYLENLVEVGLISIYTIDGDRFLRFRNFKENQTLRPDREARSSIPGPYELPEQVPDELPADSSTREVKIREDKKREEKLSGEEPPGLLKGQGPSLPTDNGKNPFTYEPVKIKTMPPPIDVEERRRELQRQAALLREGAAIETGGCFNA